ncbi:MAG: O-methyltransferase [Bacteroidales bacterium]
MQYELDDYLEACSAEEPELLQRLARETRTGQMNPRMLSGNLQGQFLAFLSSLIKPRRVLEIGTYTGYSAICLCQGLERDGLLHTIDTDDEVQEIARKYFREAGLDDRIVLHTGDARLLIPALQEKFDLVFIDGEKSEYPDYYESVLPKLNPGGIILADNVLWGGKVLMPLKPGDQGTRGILRFNELVKQDSRVQQFILPFRDGLSIIRKKY